MKRKCIVWLCALLLTLMTACSGGGGSGGTDNAGDNSGGSTGDNTGDNTAGNTGDNTGGDNNSGGTDTGTSEVVVLAANDLGMHCMDREFSVFSILPPFNVVNSQIVGHDTDGSPIVLDDAGVMVTYSATSDASGSVNSTSIGKTDFWIYAGSLFGADLAAGEGLTGSYMPQDAPTPGPQPFDFDLTHNWFVALGIPITPTDDAQNTNTYSLMRISTTDVSGGSALGSTDIVVPVAAETDCQGCHVSNRIGASRGGITWSDNADLEVQSKENILLLHDSLEGTQLSDSKPVLCAGCHYSLALDLGGTGPNGVQNGLPTFSSAMHNYHGKLNDNGSRILPDTIASCYNCHPGAITQCLRGAMASGGIDCIDCHGGMLAVGSEYNLAAGGSIDGTNDGSPRRAWADLPRCQSCHTGDAMSHATGTDLAIYDSAYPFRLGRTYRAGDSSASPLLATNNRFAENTGTLYRFSRGHGGIMCEGCHGSTHAIWPNETANANDNVAAIQIQGYAGKLIECTVCHADGSLGLTTEGPHGLHNVNDGNWVNGGHGEYYENSPDNCRACHGTDFLGTPLARVAATRTFSNLEDIGSVTLAGDDLVSCNRCHEMPGTGGDD